MRSEQLQQHYLTIQSSSKSDVSPNTNSYIREEIILAAAAAAAAAAGAAAGAVVNVEVTTTGIAAAIHEDKSSYLYSDHIKNEVMQKLTTPVNAATTAGVTLYVNWVPGTSTAASNSGTRSISSKVTAVTASDVAAAQATTTEALTIRAIKEFTTSANTNQSHQQQPELPPLSSVADTNQSYHHRSLLMLEIKPRTQQEIKTRTQLEIKTRTQQETKTRTQLVTKTRTQLVTKTRTQQETKTSTQQETKTRTHLETKTRTQQETKTRTQQETKPRTQQKTKPRTQPKTTTPWASKRREAGESPAHSPSNSGNYGIRQY
ncbi:uncharacterized protein [Procambarus clarkii]|uniref:uncharacterized protein n=1 Tax=Procambarus clarkii TaxID=6728 RepID=UPI0037437A51